MKKKLVALSMVAIFASGIALNAQTASAKTGKKAETSACCKQKTSDCCKQMKSDTCKAKTGEPKKQGTQKK